MSDSIFDVIRHEELGGGYTMRPKIILDAADLRPIGKQFEVVALDKDGEELEAVSVPDEAAAVAEFDKLVQKYAEPFQRAVNAAGLVPGHRYTLVHLGEFGFPVAQKITFHDTSFRTYAQHSDVVELIITPYRKRSKYTQLFYNTSLMIFKGWQDMDEDAISDTLKDDGTVKITQSKYSCFSASYIEDLESSTGWKTKVSNAVSTIPRIRALPCPCGRSYRKKVCRRPVLCGTVVKF